MISIITPAYNAERYIERCIVSVISQSYKDFELIVIDDGSSDGTGRILDDFSSRDSRVRVFHNDNHGVSFSRNFGLSRASGKYIMFLDSDDWLADEALAVISEHLFNPDGNGMLSFNHYAEYPQCVKVRGRGSCFMHAQGPMEIDKALEQITPNFVWDKVFSRKAIEGLGLAFDEQVSFGEDTIFLSEYLESVTEMVILPELIYHYFCNVDGDSLSKKQVYGIENIVCRIFEAQRKVVSLYPSFEKTLSQASYRGRLMWRAVLGIYSPNKAKTRKNRIEIMRYYNKMGWFNYLKDEWEHKSTLGKVLLLLLKINNLYVVDFVFGIWSLTKR